MTRLRSEGIEHGVASCVRAALDAGHVVAAFLPVTQPQIDITALLHRLSPVERERASRFHFGKDRVLYVAAHWLLSHVVDTALGPGEVEWRLTASVGGRKPKLEIDGGAMLFANLAHTAGMAAVGVSRSAEVGIDVESVRPMRDMAALADVTMTQRERSAIAAAADPKLLFFRLWTRKEAVLKACGLGLSMPLTELDVLELDAPFARGLSHVAHSVIDVELGPAMMGSVCVLGQCGAVVQPYYFDPILDACRS